VPVEPVVQQIKTNNKPICMGEATEKFAILIIQRVLLRIYFDTAKTANF
jgi:hypothetical protein